MRKLVPGAIASIDLKGEITFHSHSIGEDKTERERDIETCSVRSFAHRTELTTDVCKYKTFKQSFKVCRRTSNNEYIAVTPFALSMMNIALRKFKAVCVHNLFWLLSSISPAMPTETSPVTWNDVYSRLLDNQESKQRIKAIWLKKAKRQPSICIAVELIFSRVPHKSQ